MTDPTDGATRNGGGHRDAHFTYADDKPDRIVVTCGVCGDYIDAPNKGLGRAAVAAFKTQHQHNG